MLGKIVTIAALFGLTTAASSELYDPLHSDVMLYTKLNWDKQVMNQRDKGISVVHFYKPNGKLKT